MRCPDCGAIIPNESVLCPDCGSRMLKSHDSQEISNLKVARSRIRDLRDYKYYTVICYVVLLVVVGLEVLTALTDNYNSDNAWVVILAFAALVASIIVMVFGIKILICLSELGARRITVFQTAFTWGIVSLVCNLCKAFANDNIVLDLIVSVIGLIYSYYYIKSFRMLMEPKFPETASKWQFIWNLNIGLTVFVVVMAVIDYLAVGAKATAGNLLVPLLLLTLAPAIVSLALPFVELRYLDETVGRLDYWVSCDDEPSTPSWMNSNDI